MGQIIDLTGRRFGKLLVIGHQKASGPPMRECVCDCGRTCWKTKKYLHTVKEPWCGECKPKDVKICSYCKILKPISEYHICRSNSNGISPRCKKCISLRYANNKDFFKAKYSESMKDDSNRERRREMNRRSRIKNWEQQANYKRQYDKSDAVKKRRKEKHNIRKHADINYQIKRRLRWRIRDTVKRMLGNGYKYKSSLVLLGCDMEFFKTYMERKFTEGMSWSNISEWHIDHIKPCSKFDLTKLQEQKKCFHYSNLQPLWWLDNLIKATSYASK